MKMNVILNKVITKTITRANLEMLWVHGKCHGTRKCKTSGSYCIHVVSVLYGPRLSQVGVADRSVSGEGSAVAELSSCPNTLPQLH